MGDVAVVTDIFEGCSLCNHFTLIQCVIVNVCDISGRRALLLSRSRERSSEVMGSSLHLSWPTVSSNPLSASTVQRTNTLHYLSCFQQLHFGDIKIKKSVWTFLENHTLCARRVRLGKMPHLKNSVHLLLNCKEFRYK